MYPYTYKRGKGEFALAGFWIIISQGSLYYLKSFVTHILFSISGTPINRLPIMAKQVLDLYELYNLVCARGGLVEVINKKLWQEVIKGLGLPSSITSAAFTLRTQYTKHGYTRGFKCHNCPAATRESRAARFL